MKFAFACKLSIALLKHTGTRVFLFYLLLIEMVILTSSSFLGHLGAEHHVGDGCDGRLIQDREFLLFLRATQLHRLDFLGTIL